MYPERPRRFMSQPSALENHIDIGFAMHEEPHCSTIKAPLHAASQPCHHLTWPSSVVNPWGRNTISRKPDYQHSVSGTAYGHKCHSLQSPPSMIENPFGQWTSHVRQAVPPPRPHLNLVLPNLSPLSVGRQLGAVNLTERNSFDMDTDNSDECLEPGLSKSTTASSVTSNHPSVDQTYHTNPNFSSMALEMDTSSFQSLQNQTWANSTSAMQSFVTPPRKQSHSVVTNSNTYNIDNSGSSQFIKPSTEFTSKSDHGLGISFNTTPQQYQSTTINLADTQLNPYSDPCLPAMSLATPTGDFDSPPQNLYNSNTYNSYPTHPSRESSLDIDIGTDSNSSRSESTSPTAAAANRSLNSRRSKAQSQSCSRSRATSIASAASTTFRTTTTNSNSKSTRRPSTGGHSSRHSPPPRRKSRSVHLQVHGHAGSNTEADSDTKSEGAVSLNFVNLTPDDRTAILTGVAPSGTSKTRAKRERMARESLGSMGK